VSSPVSGYALHPEAFTGIDEIRAYIAEHSAEAAERPRVIAAILRGREQTKT
jgi:hypothetical protein